MKLLYFSWLRQRIGHMTEDLAVPPEIKTVRELIVWLKARGPGYADALDDLSVVRAAVNQEYVPLDHKVTNADEVAFFPPVTGG
ncbi:MAG: molybdopterin converting factor subunit 1 [Alphaproteobacteria bacterium]|nr:molybdopterin converting factor subunit 1 [Alphaproteobacteria bacterium]